MAHPPPPTSSFCFLDSPKGLKSGGHPCTFPDLDRISEAKPHKWAGGGGSKSKLHCTIHQLSRGESEAKLPTKTEQPSTWVNWRKVLQDYFWSRPAARNKQKYLSSCCWTCKGISRLQDMSNSQISLWNAISQQWQAGLLTRRQLAIS